TANNLASVRATMMARLGANGESLEVTPNLLVVPPALEMTARTILNAAIVAPTAGMGGNANNVAVTNIMQGIVELLVVPELNNEPTVWYLLDTSKPIKPFIAQLRKAPQLVQRFSVTDDNVFWQKTYIYGSDYRGAAGSTLPFLMSRCEA